MKTALMIGGVGLVLLAVLIANDVSANYEYERNIQSYWNLADKSSALDKKAEYLDKYVAAIESANLSGNNATIFPTPDNSYDQNLIALKSLQKRMHEIQTMDVRSFEYQQAIAQITAQEQGQAKEMLEVFEGIWFLEHHSMLWSWHEGLLLLVLLLGIGICGLVVTEEII